MQVCLQTRSLDGSSLCLLLVEGEGSTDGLVIGPVRSLAFDAAVGHDTTLAALLELQLYKENTVRKLEGSTLD